MGKEYYAGKPMPANSSFTTNGSHVAGFLAVTAGTLTITDNSPDPANIAGGPTVLLAAMPVVVGFNRIALIFKSTSGGTVTLAGGASGTLLL